MFFRYRLNLIGSTIYKCLMQIGVVQYKSERGGARKWNEAYKNGTLDYYDDLRERGRYSLIKGYLEFLGSCPQKSVLDVGCGNGILYHRCKQLAFAQWTGLDFSGHAVCEAVQSIENNDATNVKFLERDALTDFRDWGSEKYDTVILNEVLYVCDNPELMIENVLEVLSDSGHIIISNWRTPGDKHLWRLIENHLSIIDDVQVIPSKSREARKGWIVALLKHKQ